MAPSLRRRPLGDLNSPLRCHACSPRGSGFALAVVRVEIFLVLVLVRGYAGNLDGVADLAQCRSFKGGCPGSRPRAPNRG